LILSNPPYITNIEFSKLNPSVKEYEPELALIAGSDGLDIYREILRQINSLEINTKYILFETSPMVISKLAELADEHFPKSVKAKIKDKFDRERFFEIQPHETTD
jgi:release factor glutamine methyltransferase